MMENDGQVLELVDKSDLKFGIRMGVGVRVPSWLP